MNHCPRLAPWLLLLALALALAAPAAAADQPAQPGGTITTFKGATIQVRRFSNLLPEYVFVYNEISQSVPMGAIKGLALSEKGVLITMRNGKSLDVLGGMTISLGEQIEFLYLDPLTNQETASSIDPLLVNQVVFE